MGQWKKGHIPWNKGLKIDKEKYPNMGYWAGKKRPDISEGQKGEKNPMFGKTPWNKGIPHTKNTKRKISKKLQGRIFSKEHIKALKTASNSGRFKNGHKGLRRDECHFWKGGINPINDTIRKSTESRLWRESVFARDNWICQKCGKRGIELHPHHIKNFAQYSDLRFAIDNGVSFCKSCHMKFHKKYGYKNNTQKQLIKFLNN